MRVFCVGFKDQVEIRLSKEPLKEVVSKAVREMTVPARQKPDWWSVQWDGKWDGGEPTKKKFTIKSIIHEGGRVVNVISSRKFQGRTKIKAPKHGQMVEIPEEFLEVLRKP